MGVALDCPLPLLRRRRELGPSGGRSGPGLHEPGSSCAGRPRGRGAKAPRLVCEVAGVIRISDDSSTESDAGLDSDFHSSPESVLDDDVVILDAIGLPVDDRGEARSPAFATLQTGESGSESHQGHAPGLRQRGFTPAVRGERTFQTPTPPCTRLCPTPQGPLHCFQWGCGQVGWPAPPDLWPCRAPVPPAARPSRPRCPGACGAAEAGPPGQGAGAGPGAARQHSGRAHRPAWGPRARG